MDASTYTNYDKSLVGSWTAMDADVRENDAEVDMNGILANMYNKQPSDYHTSSLKASNSNIIHSNVLNKRGLETLDIITLLLQLSNLRGTSSKDESSLSLTFS